MAEITNKKYRELLEEYPDDAIIYIEYCDPTSFEYDKEHNIILIN